MSMIKEINAEDWDKEVMKPEEKPVIVEFAGLHCVWCKRLEPVYQQLSNDYSAVKMLKLVIDKNDDNIDLALKYAVDSTPTLKIFYKGVVIGELVGYEDKEFLRAEIEHIIRRKDSITGRSTRASSDADKHETKQKSEQKKESKPKHATLAHFVGSEAHLSGDSRLVDIEDIDKTSDGDDDEEDEDIEEEDGPLDIESIEKE
jgi:thioredoxin 1